MDLDWRSDRWNPLKLAREVVSGFGAYVTRSIELHCVSTIFGCLEPKSWLLSLSVKMSHLTAAQSTVLVSVVGFVEFRLVFVVVGLVAAVSQDLDPAHIGVSGAIVVRSIVALAARCPTSPTADLCKTEATTNFRYRDRSNQRRCCPIGPSSPDPTVAFSLVVAVDCSFVEHDVDEFGLFQN